jgi:hypothetical protein
MLDASPVKAFVMLVLLVIRALTHLGCLPCFVWSRYRIDFQRVCVEYELRGSAQETQHTTGNKRPVPIGCRPIVVSKCLDCLLKQSMSGYMTSGWCGGNGGV